MALFSKKHKCPKCKQTVEILYKDQSHAFLCDSCRYPLFWNAGTKEIESDTLRSKHAHRQWADRKAQKRRKAAQQAASGSSCLLPFTAAGLMLAALHLLR